MDEATMLPTCVGFIMDGNRRWAKARGLSVADGHKAGFETLKNVVRLVEQKGISHMVVYAFSTENWKRSEGEVGELLELFTSALEYFKDENQNDNRSLRVRFIGDRSRFPKAMREGMSYVEARGNNQASLTVWVALSYGGRAEMVEAVNRAVQARKEVTEETFPGLLMTAGMPDPDIIIRTSGEKRISNFLLWQSAYSEFFFIDTLWPDFGDREFQSILKAYGNRERRNGA